MYIFGNSVKISQTDNNRVCIKHFLRGKLNSSFWRVFLWIFKTVVWLRKSTMLTYYCGFCGRQGWTEKDGARRASKQTWQQLFAKTSSESACAAVLRTLGHKVNIGQTQNISKAIGAESQENMRTDIIVTGVCPLYGRVAAHGRRPNFFPLVWDCAPSKLTQLKIKIVTS